MLALSPSMRPSIRFMDASGERPEPNRLLERLNRMRPKQTALSGVSAARYWDAAFNLHGTPRLDLIFHAPDGVIDLRFVKSLDPALRQTNDPDVSPVLVIHPLIRATTFFTEPESKHMPFADPVETVLDLQELGLTQQANELLVHFRKEIRRP